MAKFLLWLPVFCLNQFALYVSGSVILYVPIVLAVSGNPYLNLSYWLEVDGLVLLTRYLGEVVYKFILDILV